MSLFNDLYADIRVFDKVSEDIEAKITKDEISFWTRNIVHARRLDYKPTGEQRNKYKQIQERILRAKLMLEE